MFFFLLNDYQTLPIPLVGNPFPIFNMYLIIIPRISCFTFVDDISLFTSLFISRKDKHIGGIIGCIKTFIERGDMKKRTAIPKKVGIAKGTGTPAITKVNFKNILYSCYSFCSQ